MIVKIAPLFAQEPPFEYVTAPPGAFAATVNCDPYAALAGACVVTEIVWSVLPGFTVSVTSGAAL